MMQKELMFSLTDVAALCNLILAIAAVLALVLNMIRKVKAPDKMQNERIAALESWRIDTDRLIDESRRAIERIDTSTTTLLVWKDETDRYIGNDKHRIDKLEANMAMLMKAQFSLLQHTIDGNDTDHLRKVQAEMQDFLLKQGISV